MSDTSSSSSDSSSFDPTAPAAPAAPASEPVASAPEPIAPPTFDAPAPPAADAPPAPTYGAPAPPAPPANPYGGYTAAPPASAQYGGQVAVGSLRYVEHHFGPVTTFADRIVPGLIDAALNLIGLIPMIIGIIIMATSAGGGSYDSYGNYQYDGGSGAGMAVGLVLLFGSFAVFFGIWLWNRVFKLGRTGQSVGKKIAGQKLINTTSGQPIGAGQSFVREVIHGLANQVVYLSYLWMLWDSNRQTLGDMVAKSTVIKVPKA